jgi:hypothetical protein
MACCRGIGTFVLAWTDNDSIAPIALFLVLVMPRVVGVAIEIDESDDEESKTMRSLTIDEESKDR